MSIAVWTLKVQAIFSNTLCPVRPYVRTEFVMNVVCYERSLL